MRKLIVIVLTLLLTSAALAEADIFSMETDELIHLRDLINLELASRTQTEGAYATWDTTAAHVELHGMKRGLDKDGQPVISLVFAYTNTSEQTDNFRENHWVKVYQNGVECDRTIYMDDELVKTDNWSKDVQPGATLKEMSWFFVIPEDTATIDVEIEDRASKSRSAGVFTVVLPD